MKFALADASLYPASPAGREETMWTRFARLVFVAWLASVPFAAVAAEHYPSRPITIIMMADEVRGTAALVRTLNLRQP
jgi:hypothetical protein